MNRLVLLRRFLLIAVVLAGAARIVSTYRVYSQVFDESGHIAAGMEWLDRGQFTYEQQHPPLSRIFCAVGLYLTGARSTGHPDMFEEGHALLYANGKLADNLAAARSGILCFYFLAAAAVYLWARRLFGSWAALAAVLQFTNLPPVLAHAGLATTDFGVAATTIAALFLSALWLENPSVRRSAFAGIAIGLALISKFSSLLYLTAALPTFALLWYWAKRPQSSGLLRWRKPVLMVSLAAFLTMWGVYRFEVDSVAGSVTAQEIKAHVGAEGVKAKLIHLALDTPLPAGKLLWGIGSALRHGKQGHRSYLFGEIRDYGWWYFFPVVLGVKTPVGFLLLALAGMALAVRFGMHVRDWLPLTPTAAAVAILLSVLLSTINLGARHILPIYGPLAVAAAGGVYWLWRIQRYRVPARAAVVALLAWQVASSAAAHPDYLPYFNEIAGRHPERILAESDLDWGQDLGRLSRTAAELKIPRLWVRYSGMVHLDMQWVASICNAAGRQARHRLGSH